MGATLRVDDIVARAVAVDGLQPADGAPWLGALELLVESASSEAGLHSGGAEAMRAKLVTLVAERLRAEVLLGANAEIRERPLPVRFVVAGLARSGTTLLHRLLSCDPDVEFLPTWQAFHPVPPLAGPDERRQDTVDAVEAMRRADPDAFAVHPLDADAPEEEVFLLQHSFASMLFALTCPLPSYNAWLSTTHHEAAYRFACDLLRLNEWRAGRSAGRPRVMKSPQFVLDLAVVSDLFPDAVVAQNHRDPVDLVGSYCSVYARSRARSCERVDPIALGRERLDHLAAMARRSADVRRDAAVRGEAGRYVDVGYERLVAEPLRVVEELYAAAGLDLTSAALAAMEGWLATHPQHAGGRHEYDLAEYGLDRAAVEAALADDIGFLTPGVEE